VTLLFAGIDGGQSSTTAVVGDQTGRILGCGTAGAADEIGVGKESTRLRDALHGALFEACAAAGLTSGTQFESIVAGVSGYDGRVYGRAAELPARRSLLLHDTPIAHAGALSGRAGAIAIAGTGSVVYGTNEDGWSITLGGWGFLFGDEGSAFAIVRDALALLMRAQDDGDNALAAQAHEVCDFFGMDSLRRLAHAFYKGGIARDRLASFAPQALRFAAFRTLAERGADRIAHLLCRAVAAGAAPRVALVGGVFADEGLQRRVRAGVLQACAQAEFVEPRYEPACGALLLAYREGGQTVTELRW